MKITKLFLFGVCWMLCFGASAEGNSNQVETDELELLQGYVGQQLGASIQEITIEETLNAKSILILLPIPAELIRSLEVLDGNDEVVPAPAAAPSYKIVDAESEGQTGLVVYVGKKRKLPIKLQLELSEALK